LFIQDLFKGIFSLDFDSGFVSFYCIAWMLGMFRSTFFFFNFMFSYLNFIILLKSLSRLSKKTQQGYSRKNAPFFPKSDAVWDKLCTRIRVATQAEKKS
jgi:hypothetical protein